MNCPDTGSTLFKRHVKRGAAVLAMASALILVSCKGVELENKVEQVDGYKESVARILLFNERNRYQNAYGAGIWELGAGDGGETFDRLLLRNVKNHMQEIKTICLMAEERQMTLNSQERDRLRQVSEAYYNGLSDGDRKWIGCSQEDVTALYTDYYMADRLVTELTANAHTEISDSEAKVIKVRQLVTEDPKKAKAILKKIKIDGSDFGSMVSRYSESEETDVIIAHGSKNDLYEKTAFSLEKGKVSNILCIGGMYYILQCTDDYNEAATIERKNALQTAARTIAFEEIYEPYKAEHKVVFTEDFWNETDLKDGAECTADNFFDLYDTVIGDRNRRQ